MKVDFVPYSPMLMDVVEELFLYAPPYAADDIALLLSERPELSLVALAHGQAVGVSARTECDGSRASTAVFVHPKYRLCGVGRALMEAMLDSMRAEGAAAAYTDFAGGDFEPFVKKFGFYHAYDSRFMRYRGDIPELDPDMLPYDDDMFLEAVALRSEAFAPLRERLGISPPTIEPDMERRLFMAEHADSIYVYTENGRIAGIASADMGEVDGVAVRKDCRGRGIGRRLVKHGIALLDARSQNATLWVVEGNPALRLYESMGFYTDRVHHFYIREI